MPNAYLVTDIQGKILEANPALEKLFKIPASCLANKLLINFISLQGRRAFRSQLAQIQLSDWVQEISLYLQSNHNKCFDASLTVASSRNLQTNEKNLR
jgi:PAS domain-containing protein